MELEYAQEYGETLLDYSFDMLWKRSTCGVNHAEFIFVRLAKHLDEHPALKGWFLSNVDSTFSGNWFNLARETTRPKGFVPSELVEYIAHVMRWPELREMAECELLKRQDDQIYLMSRNLPSSILEALEDEWEDIDFYRSLENKSSASNK